jgi:hypothetical protein
MFFPAVPISGTTKQSQPEDSMGPLIAVDAGIAIAIFYVSHAVQHSFWGALAAIAVFLVLFVIQRPKARRNLPQAAAVQTGKQCPKCGAFTVNPCGPSCEGYDCCLNCGEATPREEMS